MLTRELQEQHRHVTELEHCFCEIESIERSWTGFLLFEFEPYRTYTVLEFSKLYRDGITRFKEEADLKSLRIKKLLCQLCFMLAIDDCSPAHAQCVEMVHRSLHCAIVRSVTVQLEHIRDVLEPHDRRASQTRKPRDIPAIEVNLSLWQSVIS